MKKHDYIADCFSRGMSDDAILSTPCQFKLCLADLRWNRRHHTVTAPTPEPMSWKGYPVHLSTGDWGAWVPMIGDRRPVAGERVTITSRRGKVWGATITGIQWSGKRDGTRGCRCTTMSDPKPRTVPRTRKPTAQPASPYRRKGRGWIERSSGIEIACGYPCPVDGHTCTPQYPCHDCL